MKASQRARRNKTDKLKDMNGQWHEEEDNLRNLATDYFSQLIKSENEKKMIKY